MLVARQALAFVEVGAELPGIPAVAALAVGCAQCVEAAPVPEAARAVEEEEEAVVAPADWVNRKRHLVVVGNCQSLVVVAAEIGQHFVVGALAGHVEQREA